MEKDKIEMLLQKYWKAETTLEEEKLIKAYLSKQAADKDYTEDKHWFAAIEDFGNIGHQEIHFPIDQNEKKAIPFGYPIWLKIAAIAIMVSGLTWLGVDYNQKLSAENEALARRTAEASLISMSNALNQAYQHLNEPAELTNKGKIEN